MRAQRYGRTLPCLERKREPEQKEDWLGTKAWQDLASGLGWGAAGQSCLGHGLSSLKYLLLESPVAAHLTLEELPDLQSPPVCSLWEAFVSWGQSVGLVC